MIDALDRMQEVYIDFAITDSTDYLRRVRSVVIGARKVQLCVAELFGELLCGLSSGIKIDVLTGHRIDFRNVWVVGGVKSCPDGHTLAADYDSVSLINEV